MVEAGAIKKNKDNVRRESKEDEERRKKQRGYTEKRIQRKRDEWTEEK